MKIRTDFVTNSSSSSFSVIVNVIDKKGNNYSYRADPVDSDNEDIGPVQLEYGLASKIKKVKSVNELCKILEKATENTVDCEGFGSIKDMIETITDEEKEEWDLYPEFEQWETHFNELEQAKKTFAEKIKKECENLEDIDKVIIEESYMNTGEYCACDAINDSKLVELSENVVNASIEGKENAINEFLEYIKNSNHFVLSNEKDAEEAAKLIASNCCPNLEEYSKFTEIDMKNKKSKEYKEYYLSKY